MTGPYQGFGTGTLQSHLEYWLYHFYPGSGKQREAKVGISQVAHTDKMNRIREQHAGAYALPCWDRWVEMRYISIFLFLLSVQTARHFFVISGDWVRCLQLCLFSLCEVNLLSGNDHCRNEAG